MNRHNVSRKIFSVFLIFLFYSILLLDTRGATNEKEAKYIFLFIGDGMSDAQISVTENAFENKLLMTTFPAKGTAGILAYNDDITDSAAASTALACGRKTRPGVLGLDHEGNQLESVAEQAKKLGWKVGIVSSAPLNHATPAGFYAHRLRRGMYDEIAKDLGNSGFDYFGGGTLLFNSKQKEVMNFIKVQKYTVLTPADKELFLKPGKKYIVHDKLPYVIDSDQSKVLNLAEFTRLGIDHLYSGTGKTKGFFMMVEGGKIDWSGHVSDGGSMIHEVKSFDEAVNVAFQFYKKHPDQTTIIITADHETGGLHFYQNYKRVKQLLQQKESYDIMLDKVAEYRKNDLPFDKVIELLKSNYGIKKLSADENKELRESCKLIRGNVIDGSYLPILNSMQRIFNKRCGLAWTKRGHSTSAVPVFAIGRRADFFGGHYENTYVAEKLRELILNN